MSEASVSAFDATIEDIGNDNFTDRFGMSHNLGIQINATKDLIVQNVEQLTKQVCASLSA